MTSSVSAALALACVALLCDAGGEAFAQEPGTTRVMPAPNGCLRCHEGIEDMHPVAGLSCVDCHGGDASGFAKLEAHVSRPELLKDVDDERVPERDRDLAWRRFLNPMDLRVAGETCGACHEHELSDVLHSLHGTTAGHLSDGYYETGLEAKKVSRYGVFNERNSDAKAGELDGVLQVPAFMDRLPRDELATHYSDLARKECMQCHLWSEGRALRGRTGFDGDYRGAGCAACHVEYALDGLAETRDRSMSRTEPGHPRKHVMTHVPTTATCTSCHYGDASIGLQFRGLSQLPPGAPGGPDIPGTTDRQLHRAFFVDDPTLTPPDVHHERGMHCIDCHTQSDLMGDGRMVGAMEDAVEISCQDCHGTFDRPSTLRTERGTRLSQLSREGGDVWLTSKVTGARHPVKQVVHVLDPSRPEFNQDAVQAMTGAHGRLECYTCHGGWNVNFPGFHFDRNESLTQQDLLSGSRTPGRVTTQEKVFATWKSFYAGLNERGSVAPYLTGFSTMGSVTNSDGERILDQELPVTVAGLSGMTMIHHQLHSTRPTARSCVECHRSSATWGLGSVNFRLARRLAFVADRRGIEIVALERGALSASKPIAKVVLPDVTTLEVDCDPLQGEARWVYAAEGGRGIHVIDVRDPIAPRKVAFVATVGPRGMQLAGSVLWVADGEGGLVAIDVEQPQKPRVLGRLAMFDAHDVHVQWPWAYVADGLAGLAIVDVRVPTAPRFVSALSLGEGRERGVAIDVSHLFQYSRPLADDDGVPLDRRSEARSLAAVLDESRGLMLVDVTEAERPQLVWPRRTGRSRGGARGTIYRGLVLQSHVDLAERQGGQRTRESDYAYLLVESGPQANRRSSVEVWDLGGDDGRPTRAGAVRAGSTSEMIALGSFYNPPFLQTVLLSPGGDGVLASDVTVSAEPDQLGSFPAIGDAYAIALESFPLDRMLDEQGRKLKDVSHDGSRWLDLAEIERVLDVPFEGLRFEPEDTRAWLDQDAGDDGGGDDPVDLENGPRPTLRADPVSTARLMFARLDRDRSGFIEDGEPGRPGSRADQNTDGRISLAELCDYAGGLDPELRGSDAPPAPTESLFLATRVDADGDLSRLLDGVDPHAYDKDGDFLLDVSELRRAVYDALDLDDDGALTRSELSRYPGQLRALRYADAAGEKLFASRDDNSDGTLSQREFTLAEPEQKALDANGDGVVQLEVPRDPNRIERGIVPPPPEWPTRQPELWSLPPIVTLERVLTVFDRDKDGALSGRELRRRPDLFMEMDRDGDARVSAEELAYALDRIVRGGVDVTRDGWLTRWDLDGDGEVSREELEVPVGLRKRLPARR